MAMIHRRTTWIPVIVAGSVVSSASAVGAGPISPYKALKLPKAVHPTQHTAPVQSIAAGALRIQLEVTPLDAVKKQFGGIVRSGGDASDAVTWLCYAGRDAGLGSVVYWFASNNEMSGSRHEVTQVAIQSNASSKAPDGCGEAPVALTGIDFGVPSIGSSVDVVRKQFGTAKPDPRGDLSYASEKVVKEPKEATVTQSLQYRIRNGVVAIISVSQVSTN
jgi:hypothetical protein